MNTIQGMWRAEPNTRIIIVASRFNETVVSKLLEGAKDALHRQGVDESMIHVIRVGGAFEIPFTVKKAIEAAQAKDAKLPLGVLTLGAVVRGDTPHFEYVAGPAASGVMQVSLETGVPVIFSVLTTNTMDQAMDRAGGKAGNKGEEGAVALVEMLSLVQKIAEA